MTSIKAVLALVALLLGFSHCQQVVRNTFFGKYNVTFSVTKDAKGQPQLTYNVLMPANTYIAFGYGQSMRKVDMVAFIGDP
jgi:hypothetical protein